MDTIAGHSFVDGRCACGRTKYDLRSIVYECRSQNTTPIESMDIAHHGRLTTNEWQQMCDMVDEENKVFDAAFAQVCRA